MTTFHGALRGAASDRPIARQLARATAAAAGVLALTTLLGACDLAFQQFREESTSNWSKTYPLTATGRLEIVNTNGKISVVAGSGSEVQVEAVRRARGATKAAAEEALQKVEIVEEISADRVRLTTKTPRMRGGGVSVDYQIRVPAGAAANLQTVNGSIEVTAISGPVEVEATNGEIDLKQLGGPVKVQTTNGQIHVDLATLAGDVKLGTTNGEVRLQVPASSKADVDLQLTNGAISVDNLSFEGDKERRRVRGRINGGGSRIEVETTNGQITLAGRP